MTSSQDTVSWSIPKVRALLQHVESNKGPQGLYMKDHGMALMGAKTAVKRVTPRGDFVAETRSIDNKIYKLLMKYTQKGGTKARTELYTNGCVVLARLPNKLRPKLAPQRRPTASLVNALSTDVEKTNYDTPKQVSVVIDTGESRTATRTPYCGVDSKTTGIPLQGHEANDDEVALFSAGYHDGVAPLGENIKDVLGEMAARTESDQSFQSISSTPRASPQSQNALQPPQSSSPWIQRARQRIVDLRDADHDKQNPTPRYVSEEMRKILNQIQSVIQIFLESTGVNEDAPLNLCLSDFAVGGEDFHKVANRIFRYPTDVNIVERVGQLQMVAHLSLSSFLEAFIGATIMENVFIGWTSSFEVENDRSEFLEEYLRQNREYADLVLLSCRRKFLNSRLAPKLPIEAKFLTLKLNNSLKSFTACPLPRASARCESDYTRSASWPQNWQNSLENIFQLSLCLRLKLAMSSIAYYYLWPHSNADYDSDWMDVDDGSRATGRNRKVCLSLIPAIFPMDRNKNGERPLCKAVVILLPEPGERILEGPNY